MQAARRILRVRYPQDSHARQLCKLDEQRELLGKAIARTFEDMQSRGFRPGYDNQNPEYSVDFDRIDKWMKEQEQIANRVARLETKSGMTTEQALKDFYFLNRGRGSQSF